MTKEEWQGIYRKAWDLYYTPEHVETLLRRTAAGKVKPVRMMLHILQFYGSLVYERVHPLQGGYFRRKVRTQRRSGLPLESPLVFYPRRAWEILFTYGHFLAYFLQLTLLRKRIKKDPAAKSYLDLALAPVIATEQEDLEMFEHSDAAKAAVAKAKSQASARVVAAV